MKSIQQFLIMVTLATLTLVIFVAAWYGYNSGIERSLKQMDKQLWDLSFLLELQPPLSIETPPLPGTTDGIAFQLQSPQGGVLQRSTNMPHTALSVTRHGYGFFNYKGHRWRSLIRTTENGNKIIIAERNDLRYSLAEEIILKSVLPIIVALPVVGILIWLIIRRGLHPLHHLSIALKGKQTQDLSPLPETFLPDELMPLVHSNNDLLKRLSNSFEREKRFSSDAAHELRTPLSALKVELYNLKQQYPAEASLNLISLSVQRMSHIIEQLLNLYRNNPEQGRNEFEQFDLHHSIQETLIERYPHFAAKKQEIEFNGHACPFCGVPFAITMMVKNLLDNANKYTPEGGEILVSLTKHDTGVTLSVEDSGCGIPPELYERVFDRFYRVGGDRHNSSIEGCGLGLSIIQHCVALHRGNITLSSSRFAQGLNITIELPETEESS